MELTEKDLSKVVAPDIRAILSTPNYPQALREAFKDFHPHDIYLLCDALEPDEIAKVVEALGKPLGVEVFQEFDEEEKVEIFKVFPRHTKAMVLEEMAPDDRADFARALPQELLESVLPLIVQAERNDIKKLLEYKEGTAGSVLTTDYAYIEPDITVGNALEKIKQQAFDRETIYYIYVIDKNRHLIGFVSLKDILIAPSYKKISDIMHSNVIKVHVNDDKEKVANLLSDYYLLAVPVVDDENRLVGIVTYDDVIEIIKQENTEDIEKFMAITGRHETSAYLKTPVLMHVKNRILWLVLLAIFGFVSGYIVHRYENVIGAMVVLALYMPMLADTGGNTGSQSATVVIRAIALGELSYKDFFKVVLKEFGVSLIIACVLGIITFIKVVLLSGKVELLPGMSLTDVAVVVSLALAVQVVTSTLLGAMLPLIANRMRLDPAVIASPALTSLVDITGLLIYFNLAVRMLNIH